MNSSVLQLPGDIWKISALLAFSAAPQGLYLEIVRLSRLGVYIPLVTSNSLFSAKQQKKHMHGQILSAFVF